MIKINNLNARGMNDEFYILEEVNNTNICNFIFHVLDFGEKTPPCVTAPSAAMESTSPPVLKA